MIKKLRRHIVRTMGVFALMCASAYVYSADASLVPGFRGASFGAGEQIVRAAITKDFGIAQDKVKEQADARTGTKSLEINLPKLDPINAPVTITYIFGFKSHKLIQVNVIWNLPENNTVARDEGLAGASALAKYFAAKPFGDMTVDRIIGNPKEGLVTNYIFFRGTQMKDAGQAVTVWGAPVTLVKAKGSGDNKNDAPLTADIDKLRTIGITYEENIGKPDLRHFSVEGF